MIFGFTATLDFSRQTAVLYRGLTVDNSKCPDIRSPCHDPGSYHRYEKIVSTKCVRLTRANSVYYSVSLKIYGFTKKVVTDCHFFLHKVTSYSHSHTINCRGIRHTPKCTSFQD